MQLVTLCWPRYCARPLAVRSRLALPTYNGRRCGRIKEVRLLTIRVTPAGLSNRVHEGPPFVAGVASATFATFVGSLPQATRDLLVSG